MADFLEQKKSEISARMDELRPMVDEFHRLESALRALNGVNSTSGGGSPAASTTRRGRSGGAGGGGGAGGRRGRPRGSGTRSVEALEIVRGQPGITIPEM